MEKEEGDDQRGTPKGKQWWKRVSPRLAIGQESGFRRS
jgi:hypothetical protein